MFNFKKLLKVSLFFLILSIISAGCAASQKEVKTGYPAAKAEVTPGIVGGKVAYQNVPLLGAVVYLYEDASDNFQGKAPYVSEETGIDGRFRIKVSPGNYYLIARKGSDLACFYGGNPLTVNPNQELQIGLNMVKKVTPDAAQLLSGTENGTGIRGLVYCDGQPVAGAQVVLYLDANSNFKGLGQDQRLTDKAGRFIFDLQEGTYYLVARKRQSGQMAGPLVTGDYYAYYEGNPLVIKENKYLDVALSCVQKQDKIKDGNTERTIISGVVVDEKGTPLAGIYAGVYLSSTIAGKPDYVSPLTTADGRFQLELPTGGKYYLVGRNTYAGPPENGDLVGWYQDTPDNSVEIKTGERLTNIKLIVKPMMQ